MKYAIRRIFIGVSIGFILFILKTSLVHGLTISPNNELSNPDNIPKYVTLYSCLNSNGSLNCSYTNDTRLLPGKNTLPSNNIIKSFTFTLSNFVIDNRNDSNEYYVPLVRASDNSYYSFDFWADYSGNFEQFHFKNINIIACQYDDENGVHHDCLSDIYQSSPKLLTLGSSPNNYNVFNDIYFKINRDSYYNNLTLKIGGIGSLEGNISSVYSGYDNDNINKYFLDYGLIDNVSFSSSKSLDYNVNFAFSGTILSYLSRNSNYSISLPFYVGEEYYNSLGYTSVSNQLSQIVIDSELSQAEALKEQQINQGLTYYNEQEEDDKINHLANTLGQKLSNLMDGSPGLFRTFLSLPIELLRENSQYDLFEISGGCVEYDSSVISNLHVVNHINFRWPMFPSDGIHISCADLNVINSQGKFGRANANNNEFFIFNSIYHIILTGLLSYWLVVFYFKFVKELSDPDNNSIEVIDL